MANAERDTFKLKASGTLADQVRGRPKFALFSAAAAAAAAAATSTTRDVAECSSTNITDATIEPQPPLPPPSTACLAEPSSSADAMEIDQEPAKRRRLLDRADLMAFESTDSAPREAVPLKFSWDEIFSH